MDDFQRIPNELECSVDIANFPLLTSTSSSLWQIMKDIPFSDNSSNQVRRCRCRVMAWYFTHFNILGVA